MASITYGSSFIVINQTWTEFKASVSAKSLRMQYVTGTNRYDIFALDGPIAYACVIWSGTVPDGVIAGGYSQATNDTDKSDFTTNYQATANQPQVISVQGAVSGNALPVSGNVGATSSATTSATTVASSATNVTLLSANSNRLGATIFNDSTQTLYIKLGSTASNTSYTVKLLSNGYYEVPARYTGRIDGIWSSANGNARITELT